MDSDLTLVVMAGGRGQRLGGVIKPQLQWPDGTSLLDRLLMRLTPYARETLIVAPAEVQSALEVGHPRVDDLGDGPAIATAAASGAVQTGWMALVAGDLVNPQASVLARLIALRAPKLDAVVPVVDGFDQPLFALYRTQALSVSKKASARPRSFKAWLQQLETHRVSMDHERDAFKDVDTPEDLKMYGLVNPSTD